MLAGTLQRDEKIPDGGNFCTGEVYTEYIPTRGFSVGREGKASNKTPSLEERSKEHCCCRWQVYNFRGKSLGRK